MKYQIASFALAAILAAQPAFAGQGFKGPGHAPHRPVQVQKHTSGDALALGLVGAAAGFVIGNVIAGDNAPRVVVKSPPRDWRTPAYNHRVRPGTYAPRTLTPWTPEWYTQCRNTYRSFNPIKGTYRGYDGRDHFCSIPLHNFGIR